MTEEKRWTHGGNGSHWEGCDEVHYDCAITSLRKEVVGLRMQVELLAQSDGWKEAYSVGFNSGRWVAGAEKKEKNYDTAVYKEAWLFLVRRLSVTLSTVCVRRDEIEQWMDTALLDASNEGVTAVSERLGSWAP